MVLVIFILSLCLNANEVLSKLAKTMKEAADIFAPKTCDPT